MKKFLVSVLSFCMTVIILAQVVISAAQIGYVNTTVRFRTEPKQDAKSSFSVYVGSRVNVVSENNGWYQVEYKGKTGYIKTKYVTVDKKTKTNTTQTNTPGKPTSGVGTLRVAVKLRTEPRQDANSIMTIYPGHQVQVLSTTNGWCKVVYKKSTGYIKQDYLYIKGGTAATGSVSGIATLRVAVKFRLEPKQDAKYNSRLYPGYEVRVLSSSDGWCRVEYGGNIGYVKEQYLNFTKIEATKAPSAPAVPKPESGKGRVIVAVRYRKEPKANSISLARLYPGYEVDVVSTTNGWCKCLYKGATGYIKSDYLDITPIPTPPPTPVLLPPDPSFRGTGKIKVAVKLREQPGEGFPEKMVLFPGYECLVLEKNGEWATCEYQGRLGYFKAEYLELKKEAIKPLNDPAGFNFNGKINKKGVYLRLEPKNGAKAAIILAENQVVAVHESHGDWYRVITTKGDAGYVPKSAVTP